MRALWEQFKNLRGKTLVSIQAKHLVTEKYNHLFRLSSAEPFLHWRDPDTREEGFWRLRWIENDAGDDILLINEQRTPEPLKYGFDEGNLGKFVINEPCFICNRATIMHIYGYGYYDKDNVFLCSITVELEGWYIRIVSGPCITIHIHEDFPEPHPSDRVLF